MASTTLDISRRLFEIEMSRVTLNLFNMARSFRHILKGLELRLYLNLRVIYFV